MKKLLFILLFHTAIAQSQPNPQPGIIFANGVPPTPLLLDTYPGATAAYSVFKVRAAYGGSSLRVRRSNDNTELDIGFTGNYINEASLNTFCAGTSCYVSKLYDQSGNSLDALQSSGSNQLRIVNAGTIERDGVNNNAAMRWVASNNTYLRTAYSVIAPTITNFCSFAVFSYTNSTEVNGRLVSIDAAGAPDYTGTIPLLRDNTTNAFSGYNGGFVSSVAVPLTTQVIMSSIANSSGLLNAVNSATTASSSFTFSRTIDNIDIGYVPGVGGAMDGLLSELIIYLSNQAGNRTGIETEMNSRYAAY